VLTVGDRSGRVMSTPGETSRPAGWRAWTVADAGRSRMEQEGFSVTSMATLGSPHEEIARQAREGGFDLTLIGGPSGPHRRAMILRTGSLVLANSGSAILVSRARPRGEIQVLLVADGSDGSQAALRCFGEFADPQRCATTSISSNTGVELVRSGYYGVVVCGVSLEGGEITAGSDVEVLLRAAPTLLVARG
jgi:hypothetical protein